MNFLENQLVREILLLVFVGPLAPLFIRWCAATS